MNKYLKITWASILDSLCHSELVGLREALDRKIHDTAKRAREETQRVLLEEGLIPAIRQYRLITGADLKESKDFVFTMEQALRQAQE